MFVAVGFDCHSTAAAPAVSGDENEVPPVVPIPPRSEATVATTPRAQTSGLIRPSYVNPRPLKFAITPLESTAPTERTLSASAGAVILNHGGPPALPALLDTKIPLLAAQSAALVMIVVLPS